MNTIYLGTIASTIHNHFPNREVRVWVEDDILHPDMIAIKVRVDNCGACISVYPQIKYSEAYIADVLIAKLEEVI